MDKATRDRTSIVQVGTTYSVNALEQVINLLSSQSPFNIGRAYELLLGLKAEQIKVMKAMDGAYLIVLPAPESPPLPDPALPRFPDTLELSTRTYNCLAAAGIAGTDNVDGDLDAVEKWLRQYATDNEVMAATPNFGRKSLQELKDLFHAHGRDWPLIQTRHPWSVPKTTNGASPDVKSGDGKPQMGR